MIALFPRKIEISIKASFLSPDLTAEYSGSLSGYSQSFFSTISHTFSTFQV